MAKETEYINGEKVWLQEVNLKRLGVRQQY